MRRAETTSVGWNELQFVSWAEFKHMAPSILQLEVTRLGKIIQSYHGDTDFHNSLVRARFELRQFIASLRLTDKAALDGALAAHLRVAIMNISAQPEAVDPETRETCRYVLDRLSYVYHRIHLVF